MEIALLETVLVGDPLYSGITAENGTRQKTVIFTADIFAVWGMTKPNFDTFHWVWSLQVYTLGLEKRDLWGLGVGSWFVVASLSLPKRSPHCIAMCYISVGLLVRQMTVY